MSFTKLQISSTSALIGWYFLLVLSDSRLERSCLAAGVAATGSEGRRRNWVSLTTWQLTKATMARLHTRNLKYAKHVLWANNKALYSAKNLGQHSSLTINPPLTVANSLDWNETPSNSASHLDFKMFDTQTTILPTWRVIEAAMRHLENWSRWEIEQSTNYLVW